MASASTSSLPSSSSHIEYEVFLSFRGEDTRNTFTGHLYHALEGKGVRTFMDEPRLVSGEKIADGLWRAIECSAACIVILSEHYADSKWCLKELAKMAQSKKTILPIFFYVDPSHVRKQEGPFEQAFVKYEERSNLPCDDREHIEAKEIREWREALNEVGNIKGYHLDYQDNRNESLMIQQVLKRVLNEFTKNVLDVAKYPVGIDYRVEKVMGLLNLEANDVRIVGMCGMGGIGKTTLAKEIHNRISKNFSACCFIKNIREEVKKKGLVSIQKQLICKLCNEEKPSIYNDDEGSAMIKKRLNGKCVLIILDDIDKKEQLDSLVGELDFLGQRSRIIITTREMTVLNIRGTVCPEIYDVNELNSEESLQLFSRHAFGRNEPIESYKNLSQKIISTTNGLPLALEIIGSDLFDKMSISLWEEMLEKLKQVPHEDVQKKLIISYDGLKQKEKDAFLDSACFFIGRKKEYVVDILQAGLAIEVLQHKSIMKIDENNKIQMHDQLRDMGRGIVKEESTSDIGKRSRIYDPKEACDLLDRYKGTERVEGVRLHGSLIVEGPKLVRKSLNTKAFAQMPNLRLLLVDYVNFQGDFNKMPNNIKSLAWKYCSLKSLPMDFDLENVSFLDLSYSSIIQLWRENSIKVFNNLRVLLLDGCKQLKGCPDLSCFPNLEKLSLKGCERLVSIPESLGCLTRLIHLNLEFCKLLTGLPNSIGNLRKLRKLNLCRTTIKKLPDTMGSLENLEVLEARLNSELKELPDSIKSLTKLEVLDFQTCVSLVVLPESFACMTRLRRLDLLNSYCLGPGLDSIGSLTRLEELSLGRSSTATSLDGLCNLTSLSKLDIESIELEKFPDWVATLENLKELSMNCDYSLGFQINSIGRFTKLQKLSLRGRFSWRTLVHFINCLKGLSYLYLKDDEDMEEISDCIGFLENLESLSICACRNLRHPSKSIGSLTKLETLRLEKCGSLSTWCDSIGNVILANLSGLYVRCHDGFELIGDYLSLRQGRSIEVGLRKPRCPLPLREMTNLKCLYVADDRNLKEKHEGENEGEGCFQVSDNAVDVVGHCHQGRDYMRISLSGEDENAQYWELHMRVGDDERKIEVVNRGERDKRQWMRHIFPTDFAAESVETSYIEPIDLSDVVIESVKTRLKEMIGRMKKLVSCLK